METAVRTEVKVEQIQEGLGAITQSMVDSNVTTARTETKIESLQGGIGAFRQNIVDEKVSR
jgi:peptidoglycan hydrolase CwlO-like protein